MLLARRVLPRVCGHLEGGPEGECTADTGDVAVEGGLSWSARGGLLPAAVLRAQGGEAGAGAPGEEYSVEIREPHGIWGGLNETERRDLLERGLEAVEV
jgi:hypothetical protein